jgi:hypothetical protein
LPTFSPSNRPRNAAGTLVVAGFDDVAVRDVVMAVCAVALARLPAADVAS